MKIASEDIYFSLLTDKMSGKYEFSDMWDTFQLNGRFGAEHCWDVELKLDSAKTRQLFSQANDTNFVTPHRNFISNRVSNILKQTTQQIGKFLDQLSAAN